MRKVQIILFQVIWLEKCGERGIRTLETPKRLHAFQACAFSHSATSPKYQNKKPQQKVGVIK